MSIFNKDKKEDTVFNRRKERGEIIIASNEIAVSKNRILELQNTIRELTNENEKLKRNIERMAEEMKGLQVSMSIEETINAFKKEESDDLLFNPFSSFFKNSNTSSASGSNTSRKLDYIGCDDYRKEDVTEEINETSEDDIDDR